MNLKFKPKPKHLTIAVLVLGFILIAFAVIQSVFKIKLDPKVQNDIPTVIMFAALGLMLWNRKLRKEEAEARAAEEKAEKEALEAKNVTDTAGDPEEAKPDVRDHAADGDDVPFSHRAEYDDEEDVPYTLIDKSSPKDDDGK
jgi:hypothetical protein